MKIVIGGDFAPTEYNTSLFEAGDAETLYTSELLEYLRQFDFRIFDFECCFEGHGNVIKKNGPIITASDKTIAGIRAVNPSIMVMANNHTGNLGEEGIQHTKEIFDQYNIRYLGAGYNFEEAKQPLVIEKEGIKVGLYACAEHEFTYASEHTGGVNPYDPLETFDQIRELKSSCDYVICFFHGGMIDYRYPLPNEQRVLRKMVDSGADLVVGQHTHCIGAKEEYKGKNIIYGQGDFLFARPTNNEYRYSGLLIEIDLTKEKFVLSYQVRIKPDNTIRLADQQEKDEILSAFYERSEELNKPEKIKENLLRHLRDKGINSYLRALLGRKGCSYGFMIVNKLTKHYWIKRKYDMIFKHRENLKLINYLECETHHEAMTMLLKDMEGLSK